MWLTVTFIGGLPLTGMDAPTVIDSPINGEIFRPNRHPLCADFCRRACNVQVPTHVCIRHRHSQDRNPVTSHPEKTVLVLQGGGAPGAYQAGAFEVLFASGRRTDWVAGVSKGAINAALIAGNAPELRVERLHALGIWSLPVRPPRRFSRVLRCASSSTT